MVDSFPMFEVPVILPDLTEEETLIKIADCLDHLAKITDTVFDCINSRIIKNKNKISDLQQRATLARMKVEKLKGIRKATQIFSTAKYPLNEIHKDYLSFLNDMHKAVFISSPLNISARPSIPKDKPTIEKKLQFFQVKSSAMKLKKAIINESERGLEKLPSNVQTVSSLLLFNTSENPYENYVNLDPMVAVNKMRKTPYEEIPYQMEAAPISISKQEQLDEQVKENYFYLPVLGDVPNLDAPLDLPDLPGVADDLKYNLDLEPGFAPSVITTPAAPDLPNLPVDSIPIAASKNGCIKPKSQYPVQFSDVQVLPPLPPPLPQLLPSPETISSSLNPPCPPPLPAVESEKSPAIIHATSGDARANLMAAIRDAGGRAKLKSVQSGRDETKRIKEEKNLESKSGDLMADLHSKLLLRRKGISGKTKKDSEPVVTAMGKVSAMIPSPVQYDMSSATEDEDWEE